MATLSTLEAQTTILSLPPEIIDVIASKVRWYNASWTCDMGSCSLACKALLSIFQPLFFSYVFIDEGNMERFSNVLAENPKLRGYVHAANVSFLGKLEKDMAELFCKVASHLTHIRQFEADTGNAKAEIWDGYSSSFQEGMRIILTSPTLTSIRLDGNIFFAVPPRLLLCGPAIKDITLTPVDETFRDIGYWASLDAAGEPSFPTPATRPKTLSFFSNTLTRDESNWFPYVVSTWGKQLSHLTDLTVHSVSQSQLQPLQTLLYSLRGNLRNLDLRLCLPENQRLDLSRNAGLRSLHLFYGDHFLHDGLSVLQDTLSGLNARFLRKIILDLTWDCPGPELPRGNFPQLYLRELDTCFARLKGRHPRFKFLAFGIAFAHFLDEECGVWDEFNDVNSVDSLKRRHFPFLCYDRPDTLCVVFMQDLSLLLNPDCSYRLIPVRQSAIESTHT